MFEQIGKSEMQMKLAQGVFVNLSGKAFGRSAHIVGQVILARLVGPFNFGLYGIGWNILRIAGILAVLGLDSGVIHFASRYWRKDKEKFSETIVSALLSVMVFGSFAGIVIFLLAYDIGLFFNKPQLGLVLRWFSIAFPVLAGVRVIASSTRATMDMRYANLIEEIVQPGTNLLLIGLVFILGGELTGYVAASSTSIILSFIAGIIILKAVYKVKAVQWVKIWDLQKTLITYSLPIALPAIFGTLIILIDRIFVGYFLPEFETGIYQSVSLISVLFIAILSSFKSMVAPMIAECFHLNNLKELELTMRTSTRWVFNLCLPLFLIILVAPEAFMTTLFGEAYLIGSQTLLILTLAQLINVGKGPIDQLLIMTGNQKVWFKITFTAFIGNIAANWIFIPIYGLTGAAFANAITFAGLSAGGLYFSSRRLGFLPFDRYWVRSLLAAIVTATILITAKLVFHISAGLELLAVIILSVSLFYGFLVWAGLSEDDKSILNVVIGTIKKKFL